MDNPAFNRSLAPTKRGFTLDTPHLVASVNLGNAHAAIGTRARIFAQLFYGIHVFLFTFVRLFFAFNRPKTLGTSIFRTKVAFVLCRQHSAASRGLALHHKLSSRTRRIPHFIDNNIVFAIQFVDLCPMFINLRHYFRHSFIRIRDFGIPQRTFIMFGDFRNGHISQYGPSMLSVVFLHKRCIQCRFGKFNVPFVAAFHTMRVICSAS